MTAAATLRRVLVVAATLVCVVSPVTAETGWSGQFGVLLGSHDNFFFRGGDAPAPESDLLSGGLELERTLDAGRGEWTLAAAATTVEVSDIAGADYQSLEFGAEYKRGPWKAAAGYGVLLNRLFAESGEPVFFDQGALDVWLRYSVNRRVWVRLRAERADQDFDPPEDERDADVDKYELAVRFAATDSLGVRLFWLSEDRTALGPENNRTGSGAGLALEGSPREDLTWFLRYRSRDRDYEDAASDDSNFGRSDTVEDVSFNIRWRFAESIGLMVRDNYRSGDSTRLDRNFTGNVIEAGVFFQFGTE